MILGDAIMLGGTGGETASIFVTGLTQSDQVVATKGSKSWNGVWGTRTVTEHDVPLIPTMTSNTTPSGTASCSQNQRDEPAYYAFDNNNGSCWFHKRSVGAWVQYVFPSSVTFNKISIKNVISNSDRTAITSVTLSTENGTIGTYALNTGSAEETIINLSQPITATTIKLTTASYSGSNTYSGVTELQIYGDVTVTKQGHLITNLGEYGTYTVTATDGTQTATQNVLVDVATEYEIAMRYSRLPVGYTEVKCIVSSGTQYIDTGTTAKYDSTKVEISNFAFTSFTEWLGAFGVSDEDGEATTFWLRWLKDNSTIGSAVGTISSGTPYTNWSYSYSVGTVLNKVVFDRANGLYVNDVQATRRLSDRTVANSTYNMYMFAINQQGTAWRTSSAKMGEVKIYDGNTLVRDFVPCINSNNAVGMYDLVSNAFFGNDGTDSFTYEELE